MAEKILVAGDVDGNFDELYKKVNKVISSHRAFSFLLVAGNFFGDSESEWLQYKSGSKSVPIDTYILGPNDITQLKYFHNFKSGTKELKLCEKIICLGKQGVFVTSSGLTVAYLSGFESRDNNLCGFTESEVLKFIRMVEGNKNYRPIDILITLQWPKDITSEYKPENPSTVLQMVVKTIIPRYIFCATEGKWYKRLPYNNDNPYAKIVSRFIALGRVKTKEKWLYALELTKDIPELNKPLHTTNPSPFKDIFVKSSMEAEQYRWDLKRPSHSKSYVSKRHDKKMRKEDSDCWFCLSSPNVEKHFIISICSESYVARAKGGLVNNHLIISSVTHIKYFYMASNELREEINRYKIAINEYFEKNNCSAVFFETCLRSTLHFQVHAVPVPISKIPLLKTTFEEYGFKYELDLECYSEKYKFKFPGEEECPQYFFAELPTSQVFFMIIHDKFPISFARYVLADSQILNQPDRINWRDCCETMEKEIHISNKIREDFKPYDLCSN